MTTQHCLKNGDLGCELVEDDQKREPQIQVPSGWAWATIYLGCELLEDEVDIPVVFGAAILGVSVFQKYKSFQHYKNYYLHSRCEAFQFFRTFPAISCLVWIGFSIENQHCNDFD